MNLKLLNMQIDDLNALLVRKEEEIQKLRRLGGNYGAWEAEAARQIRKKIAEIQGQLDAIDNPDEIFF